MSGPRWKGKDGKDFSALAAANPMSSIVPELRYSLKCSNLVATLSSQGGVAILRVNPQQTTLLNRAAFGWSAENAGAERERCGWAKGSCGITCAPHPSHFPKCTRRTHISLFLDRRTGWCGQICSMVQICVLPSSSSVRPLGVCHGCGSRRSGVWQLV
jgi:hypothetical protein